MIVNFVTMMTINIYKYKAIRRKGEGEGEEESYLSLLCYYTMHIGNKNLIGIFACTNQQHE